MRTPLLRWQVFLPFALLILLALAVFGFLNADFDRQRYQAHLGEVLALKAELLGQAAWNGRTPENERVDPEAWASRCRSLGVRGTLVLPSGSVLADSSGDPARMENHATRPEIAEALQGSTATAFRASYTIHEEQMYLAIPWVRQGRVAAVVRVAIPLSTNTAGLHQLYVRLGVAAAGVLAAGVIAAFILSRRLSRPWERVSETVRRFAQGDLSRRLPELAALHPLAQDLNRMAEQLGQRLATVQEQRESLQTIFASMHEGVLTVDSQDRITSANQTAEQWLGLPPGQAKGRAVYELLRNTQLLDLLARSRSENRRQDGTIRLSGDAGRILQVNVSPLQTLSKHPSSGALLVFNDITQLHRLEGVRRDFVANVSHELKTPITLIQGYLETLIDDNQLPPQQRRQFLSIMSEQTQRLNTLIEDLLALSRLEQVESSGAIEFSQQPLLPILKSAAAAVEPMAKARSITIELDCPAALEGVMNERLFERAVINLLDNAVKYSDPGRRVRIEAGTDDAGLFIRVRDEGIGIAPVHLPRLFERFYRIDKARSREAGGSGLGLAIVKHILQVHHGRVSVESVPGQGSTFILHLPAAPAV